MYGCYRKNDSFDPEMFSAGAAAVLSEYPVDIVDLVTDPRTGLPSKLKWPPEVKEVRDACDDVVRARQASRDRDASLRAQFAERDEFERAEAERHSTKRPTLAQLEAQGLVKPKPKGANLPPDRLWARWCEQRRDFPGHRLSDDARAILEAAGYVVDGPDDQQPKGMMP